MTTPEGEAEIIRLHFAEHWRVGTIAAQLGVHPDVVRRVLGLGDARPGATPRPRLVDPYRAFIAETLARYPRLRATRLHDMVAQRGYIGAVRTLREYVAEVRPRPRREVYLRIEPEHEHEEPQRSLAAPVDLRLLAGTTRAAGVPRGLVAERRAARDLKGRDRSAPSRRLSERFSNVGRSPVRASLLDLYGNEIFAVTLAEIVARGLRVTGICGAST